MFHWPIKSMNEENIKNFHKMKTIPNFMQQVAKICEFYILRNFSFSADVKQF